MRIGKKSARGVLLVLFFASVASAAFSAPATVRLWNYNVHDKK